MRKASKPNLVKQAGVTILEFIAFIGLAAVVLAGALGLYKTASQGASLNAAIATANGLVASARQAGAGVGVSWNSLCMTDSTLTTCGVKIPAITGWETKNSAGAYTLSNFSKSGYLIQFSDSGNYGKVVITFPTEEEASVAKKLSVGGIATGDQAAAKVTWDLITK